MKNITLFLVLVAFCWACSGRKDYSAEDYKQQQADYEQRKVDILKSNGEAYRENKAELMRMTSKLLQLQDTATVFADVPKDSLFFYEDNQFASLNFSFTSSDDATTLDAPIEKVVFLQRRWNDNYSSMFEERLGEVTSCYTTHADIACLKLKEEEINDILGIKYAFVVDEIVNTKPIWEDEGFQGGYYVSRVVCYDLTRDKAIYSFMVSAESSDEVNVQSYGSNDISTRVSAYAGQAELNRDFRKNRLSAFREACKKHFALR